MENLNKIYKEIEKLYDADSNLIDILAVSGFDSETQYKEGYHDMLDDTKALQKALHALLDNFNDVITDIEFEVSTPIKKQTGIEMVRDAMEAVKKTERALYGGG